MKGFKLTLTIGERLGLRGYVPEETSQLDMETWRDIAKKIKLTSDERELLKKQEKDVGMVEDEFIDDQEYAKEFEFERSEVKLMKNRWNALNSKNKIKWFMCTLGTVLSEINVKAEDEREKEDGPTTD